MAIEKFPVQSTMASKNPELYTIKDFFKKFGTDTTTNFQLISWGKELRIPNLYIVMRNEIKELPENEDINVIYNLHLKEQRGIHWSCFSRKVNMSFHFDSYGLEPTKEVENILTKPFIYSTHKLQDDQSTHLKKTGADSAQKYYQHNP